ncbi:MULTISPECIES: hypothetical protein [unclassified Caulobacter]|jgi:hypothetical protein|uniref:hypothetical protein n=1 Tax=unclassified Caulobacter TaxID=2648921 RepID=UPI000784EFC2|nr:MULTISPECIES: hypothetical protein [unclassified Caulobacter]MCA0359015.1 hypothetical protein [Pseudomonadota bacterium]PIB89980.1 hypothetical protein CSW62_25430 [Caulobacter sp. FWC2]
MFEFTKTTFDHIDDDLIAQHLASGMPRYSNTLYLLGGGFIRRWTDDEAAARTQLQADRTDPNLSWAIAFDHMTVWAVDVAFAPNSKSAEQLRAECDEALDAMFERWVSAEEGAR